ncbi:unnamed protein product [Ectocarpus sp. CCAP 1310/34]|nr:unnamed protein product [Ectocarpus sp. CCAP 1310/34]
MYAKMYRFRRALSQLVRVGSNDAPAHNIGVLAASGGFSLFAAWLAILWEGRTVVPLSTEAPVHRTDSILADAMVRVVLVTDEESAVVATKASSQNVSILRIRRLEATAAGDGPVLCDSEQDVPTSFDSLEKAAASNGDAYLYYTSGCSGEPKGVSFGHGSMDEVCCQRVEHVFIDFVAEVFGPLSCAILIIVVPSEVRKNSVLLRDYFITHGVTWITLVPTQARRIAEAALMVPSTFGMASKRSISAKMNNEIYGFATTGALTLFKSFELQSDALATKDSKQGAEEMVRAPPSVSIGRPISNCGVELLEVSQHHKRRDEGRVGLLYVSGAGLARGYWGRPTATDPTEALPLHVDTPTLQPHGDGDARGDVEDIRSGCQHGQKVRFFCKGDLASFERSQKGGGWSLVCRGRLDQQIKINGRRLDFTEVEHGGDGRERSDWGVGDVVGVVVVAVSTTTTLLDSGKVDCREVRRMVSKHWHHHHASASSDDADHSAASVVSGTRQGSTSVRDISVEKGMSLVNEALVRTIQSYDRLDMLAERNQIGDDSNLFVEVGLSSVQARLVLTVGAEAEDDKIQQFDDVEAGEERLQTLGVAGVHVRGGSIGTSNDKGGDERGAVESARDSGATFTIRPITEAVLTETRALNRSVFLNNEPLLSSRFARYRATLGPVGAVIVRQCQKRLVGCSIDSLRRGGGRVLVATDDASGQVLGFTIGTELTESAQGSGEPTSFRRRTDTTPWQKSIDFLLGLPLQPMLRRVSALFMELLSILQYERGWAYAPGDVMNISETGCRPGQQEMGKGKSKHQVERVAGGETSDTGNGGVQTALMAEMLERQLLRNASAAGFLPAVPSALFSAGQHSTTAHGREHSARPEPFARVAGEHADVILFEKVLAPGVPPGMLLGCRPQQAGTIPEHSAASLTVHSNTATHDASGTPRIHAVAFAAGERWQLVQAGRGTGKHYSEMLAAFLLLTAPATVCGSGTAGGVTVVASSTKSALEEPGHVDASDGAAYAVEDPAWTIAACMSWRRYTNPRGGNNLQGPVERGSGDVVSIEGRSESEEAPAGRVTPASSRELLACEVGDSHVHLRALSESVGFYERHGFRGVDHEGCFRAGKDLEGPVRVGDGECSLVHDLGQVLDRYAR